MILLPETQDQMFFLQYLWLGGRLHAARKKQRMKVRVAERFQRLVPAQQLGVQLPEHQFMIEMEPRFQIVVGQKSARSFSKCFSEGCEIFYPNGQARRHFVAAEFLQMRRAMVERRYERQAFNAASASLSESGRIEGDQDRGPAIFSGETGGDNPKHARMPLARSKDNGRVAFRLESFLQFLFRVLADFSFDSLTFAVLRVQERGQLLRFPLFI